MGRTADGGPSMEFPRVDLKVQWYSEYTRILVPAGCSPPAINVVSACFINAAQARMPESGGGGTKISLRLYITCLPCNSNSTF